MEAGRKNLRAVAERLATLVDDVSPEVIFVVGEVQSRSDLTPTLEDRVAQRVVELDVGARNSGFADAELNHAVDQEFLKRRLAAIEHAAEQFSQAIGQGSGLATQGLDGVCAALRAGAVETLIIGDIGDTTVVAGDDLLTVAPNEKVLSELGTAPTQTLRADEALPLAAIRTGAALIRTDERITPDGGIAALLRYALP
jgi:stalled ribosome rescue protein Dom34